LAGSGSFKTASAAILSAESEKQRLAAERFAEMPIKLSLLLRAWFPEREMLVELLGPGGLVSPDFSVGEMLDDFASRPVAGTAS
jgi:hypothetical protein